MEGSLLQAAIATYPDITQAVGGSVPARPNEAHVTAVKREPFTTSKEWFNLSWKYEKEGVVLTGYSDADWAEDQDDRHSTTGNQFVISGAGGPVSWLSKEQPMVSLSTSEAEYVALYETVVHLQAMFHGV